MNFEAFISVCQVFTVQHPAMPTSGKVCSRSRRGTTTGAAPLVLYTPPPPLPYQPSPLSCFSVVIATVVKHSYDCTVNPFISHACAVYGVLLPHVNVLYGLSKFGKLLESYFEGSFTHFKFVRQHSQRSSKGYLE